MLNSALIHTYLRTLLKILAMLFCRTELKESVTGTIRYFKFDERTDKVICRGRFALKNHGIISLFLSYVYYLFTSICTINKNNGGIFYILAWSFMNFAMILVPSMYWLVEPKG